MKLSLLEILILANTPKDHDKPNKSAVAMSAQEMLKDPNCSVPVVMATIDNLVKNNYIDKTSDFVFTLSKGGAKVLNSSYKELQDIVYALPKLLN